METNLLMHGDVIFPKNPRRYYQRPGRKHASGSAEWHSRPEYLRRTQRAIAKYNGGGPDALRSLVHELEAALDSKGQ